MRKEKSMIWNELKGFCGMSHAFLLTDCITNVQRLAHKLAPVMFKIIQEDWAWSDMNINAINPLIINKNEVVNAIIEKTKDQITASLISNEISSAIFQKIIENNLATTNIADAILFIELCELIKIIKGVIKVLHLKTQKQNIIIDISSNLYENLLEHIIIIDIIGDLSDLISCANLLVLIYVLYHPSNCFQNSINVSEQHLNTVWKELQDRTQGRVKLKFVSHAK
ncbi:MAG: hypothetical protein GXO48_08115 [Chlorobi bacterium]|nr:hypothetical protein [Chlorobiota bacterium]